MASSSSQVVRLSVNLSSEVAGLLRWIAGRHDISATEVIRRAISTQAYIEEAHDRGAKMLVKEPGEDTLRELLFIH